MVWINRGITLGKLEKYDEAIKSFNKALELYPNQVLALSNKGIALGKLGKYDEALIYFNKAIELDSEYKPALEAKKSILKNFEKNE